jgi:WD40 repeat protein
MHIWEVATGNELVAFTSEQATIVMAALLRDGNVLSVSEGAVVRRWHGRTGKEIEVRQPHVPVDDFSPLALSADGELLAIGKGYEIGLCDTSRLKQLKAIPLPHGRSHLLALGRDGQRLAAVRSGIHVHFWYVLGRNESWHLTTDYGISCIRFSRTGRLLACGGGDHIEIFESDTGRKVREFVSDNEAVQCLAFTPDGRGLASGHEDSTILIWELPLYDQQLRGKVQPHLRQQDLEELWVDLASSDSQKAYRAVWRLQGSPTQFVHFIRRRMREFSMISTDQIEAWISDLDSAEFSVRERAFQALEEIDAKACPFLKRALRRNSSVEGRVRIERLLNKLELGFLSPQHLRESRAVEVLEGAWSPETGDLLQTLAAGPRESPLTQEAKAALGRRPSAVPLP